MDRRKSLKSIMTISGALVTLPSWAMGGWESKDVINQAFFFSEEEQSIISILVDTIIPTKDEYGGLAQEVDKFLIKLLDQCYEIDDKENVKKHLHFLNKLSKDQYGKTYMEATQEERASVFLSFDNENNEKQKAFFDIIKRETIRGFETSKVIMRRFYNYKVAPGHYYGCVEIKSK